MHTNSELCASKGTVAENKWLEHALTYERTKRERKDRLFVIFTPPLEEFGEIRGMSISKTTTAKSWRIQKEEHRFLLAYFHKKQTMTKIF